MLYLKLQGSLLSSLSGMAGHLIRLLISLVMKEHPKRAQNGENH